ncbi:hypothetical protein E2C01_047607 [Portunus trituberculatus]|uniref:Uncharacterized protein n=1 Tax=Portunus trituberculatus TaxID=210409 RepID=A0A5B7G7X5_PORTR|nr:hypothetical protein [Portunus trituberculatus]
MDGRRGCKHGNNPCCEGLEGSDVVVGGRLRVGGRCGRRKKQRYG